jgi:hypothetical protein
MELEKKPAAITIEDLQPKQTSTGYRATWREQDLVAVAEFVPIQGSPLRGFVLLTSCHKASDLDQISQCQQELANTLLQRLQTHLNAAGWLVIGRLGNPPREVWQHQNRLWGKKSDQQSQSLQAQNVALPGPLARTEALLPDAPVTGNPIAEAVEHQDEQKASMLVFRRSRAVTFTCEWCRQEVIEQRFPSHLPRYCSNPACKKEAVRAKSRKRTAAWRRLHPDARCKQQM